MKQGYQAAGRLHPRSGRMREALRKAGEMLILPIILPELRFGSFPAYPYSRSWGYYPSGGLGLILAIVMLLNHGF